MVVDTRCLSRMRVLGHSMRHRELMMKTESGDEEVFKCQDGKEEVGGGLQRGSGRREKDVRRVLEVDGLRLLCLGGWRE